MKVACGKGYEILLVRKSAVDVRKSAAKSVDRRKKVW